MMFVGNLRRMKKIQSDYFSLDNLPYGVFRPRGSNQLGRIGVAFEDKVLDISSLVSKLSLPSSLTAPVLNAFMDESPQVWHDTRFKIRQILADTFQRDSLPLIPRNSVEMLLPANIGDYTDFYASENHATNVGIMFRGKDNALMPNWKHLPVGYHGRSSSVRVSGEDVIRPKGQFKKGEEVVYGSSEELDFELELACFIGGGNKQGNPIPIENASSHIFGFVLMNDWSARDLQRWEYQPLGPFLGKNFHTTISPWVVPLQALEPFRIPLPSQSPQVVSYLSNPQLKGFDFQLNVDINGHNVSQSNPKHLYWSFEQMIAHHTVNGCNLRSGDLIASGTISGQDKGSLGSLLELSWNKSRSVKVGHNERHYLQDGDEVAITGFAEKDGIKVGFGDCTAKILPSV